MHASNICTAVESLLLLISDLKRHYLVSDARNVARLTRVNIDDEQLIAKDEKAVEWELDDEANENGDVEMVESQVE